MCAFQAKALGAGARIEWDPESLTLLGSPAGYGRVIRLKTGALLACFGKGGRVHLSSSSGDGRTWSASTRRARSNSRGRSASRSRICPS